ncbi:MAG: hypothetical protein KAJ40_02195 [Alphaproteobacteria bacterium]|nr:hypothetical protein [Alphaproteobacteria bacterium]
MNKNSETIDKIILSSAAGKEWQKTAMVISKVFDAPEFEGASLTGQDVANRIRVLVEDDKLEAKGNLRRWRDSTVRLIVKPKA